MMMPRRTASVQENRPSARVFLRRGAAAEVGDKPLDPQARLDVLGQLFEHLVGEVRPDRRMEDEPHPVVGRAFEGDAHDGA